MRLSGTGAVASAAVPHSGRLAGVSAAWQETYSMAGVTLQHGWSVVVLVYHTGSQTVFA
jgi:hypothetical protein